MRNEAYIVSYDRANYHTPIGVQESRESVLKAREETIMQNMLHYLGEYRLGVKFDEFFYRIEKDSITGERYFSSVQEGPIRNIFQRAISTRKHNGLSIRRETAECLGFRNLEEQLINAKDDTLFIWVSPPGPRSDGYGDYSFTFVGQAVKDQKSQEQRIRVVPYRNILSQEEHKGYLKYFEKEAGNFSSDTHFLAHPIVFSPTKDIKTPEDVVIFIGEHEKVSTRWYERLQKRVGPLIQRYIELVRRGGSDEELTTAKFVIENYTIAIKGELEKDIKITNEGPVSRADLDRTIEIWGRNTPPAVSGSCGSTKSTLLENQNEFNKTWEYHTGDCIVCGSKDVAVGPCNICRTCEKKFDDQ